MTTSTYVLNRTIRKNALYSYNNGVGKWLINGEWISDTVMDMLYPVPKIVLKPNPDKRNLWMNNTKSY